MSVANATLRLLSALILGGVIGLEREVNSRAAGLRTHMLISLASATFAIVAMELTSFEGDPDMAMRIDPLTTRRTGVNPATPLPGGTARSAPARRGRPRRPYPRRSAGTRPSRAPGGRRGCR